MSVRLKNLIVCLESWKGTNIVACCNCPIYKKRGFLKRSINISIRIKEDLNHYCYNCDLGLLTTQKLKTIYSILYYKLCI